MDAPTPEPTMQTLLAELEERLRQHIADAAAEIRRYVDDDGARTRHAIEHVVEQRTAELGRYIDTRLADERRHGDERHGETRRYVGVLGESLMTKIELVADGGRTNAAQLERFRSETRDQFAQVDRRLMRLVASRPRRRRS